MLSVFSRTGVRGQELERASPGGRGEKASALRLQSSQQMRGRSNLWRRTSSVHLPLREDHLQRLQ